MIYAKIINQGKEYKFEPLRVDREKIFCVEMYNISKYFFSFTWEGVIGSGTIEVLATNDGINFVTMKYGDDQDMILAINTASGSSHFADYIGHASKFLCFKLSGFTDGYFNGTLNVI
jgi:hypothetical protein